MLPTDGILLRLVPTLRLQPSGVGGTFCPGVRSAAAISTSPSSFWTPTGGFVKHREYFETRLPKKGPQTPGGRDVRWHAPSRGDKIVLLEHPRFCRSATKCD